MNNEKLLNELIRELSLIEIEAKSLFERATMLRNKLGEFSPPTSRSESSRNEIKNMIKLKRQRARERQAKIRSANPVK